MQKINVSDDEIISLVTKHSSFSGAAGEIGVSVAAFSAYLSRRPALYKQAKSARFQHKICPLCKTKKPANEFGKRAGMEALNAYCATCRNFRTRERRAANPHARQKEQEYENRQEVKLRSRARNYGLTLQEFYDLLDSHNGECAVCNKALTFKSFVIDHCHSFNKVRGILCPSCNIGIGQLGDTLEGVMRAARYLEQFELPTNPQGSSFPH